MRVHVNASAKETNATTVEGLVAELGFSRGTVLVEHNGTALRPDEWSAAQLRDSDRIEVLRIVAGG